MQIEDQLWLIKVKLINQLDLDPETEVAPIWDETRTHAGAIVRDWPELTFSLDEDSNLVVQRERPGRIEYSRLNEDGEPEEWKQLPPPRSRAAMN